MPRAASWVVALIGLAVLTVLCVRCHGPEIEAELAESTSAALGGEALETVGVTLSGRDVTLTGVAESEAERERFGALAARVRGVRAVDNRLRLAGEPDPGARPLGVTPSPEGLTVQGTVPDDAARRALLARVAEAFPGQQVTDALQTDASIPESGPAAMLAALGAIATLPAGTLSDGALTMEAGGAGGGTVVLRGRVPDAEARTQAEDAVQAAIEAPWTLRSELTVGTAAVAPADSAGTQVESAAPGDADVAAVQAALQEVFVPGEEPDAGSGQVEFETGTSRLTDDSRDLLDQASGVLRRYDDVTIEVQGHTDAEGSAASNLRLSEQRADAVRRYLSDAGVDRTRLTVRGFGETRPIATNDTEAGRARNRRVVFRLGTD